VPTDEQPQVWKSEYEQEQDVPAGRWETIAHYPRRLRPDTMSWTTDGYLYVTAHQLHRQAHFHDDQDMREQPYAPFRVKVDAETVLLR
jgi:hypothetical protein